MWDFNRKCNFQNTFPYRKITVCVLVVAASSTMYVCVCPMLPVELVVAGRERRGRNPVDFLIKGKQFLNGFTSFSRLSPVFFSSSLEMPKMDHFYDHFGLL